MPGTPTLEFTGTDVDTDSVRYQIHIDTVNTFDGSGFALKYVDVDLSKAGAPSDNLTLELLSGSMTGTVLGTSDAVPASSVPASHAYVRFTFATPVSLTGGIKYYLRLTRSGARDGSNFFSVGISGASSYSGGGEYIRSNNVWGSELTAIDWRFIVYNSSVAAMLTQDTYAGSSGFSGGAAGSGEDDQAVGQSFTPATTLLNKLSGTDSGFANTVTGGDTDPFNSGEKASFTVQAGDALAPGTYYWRVRGIDPTGSNSYGAWAATRSFTITAAAGFPPFPRPLPMPMAPILAQ